MEIIDDPAFDIDDIEIPDFNAREHPETQLAALSESIKQFGFTIPVTLDKTRMVIAGVGRVMAARQLGLKTIPVRIIKDLSEAQAREYSILDNHLFDGGGWNDGEIDRLLKEIGDGKSGIEMSDFGFTTERKVDQGSASSGGDKGGEGKEETPQIASRVFCPHCGHTFRADLK